MTRPTPRMVWTALALATAAAAFASIGLTLWMQLHPCHLCIFQRLLFMVLAVLAVAAGLAARPSAPGGRLHAGLAGLFALIAAMGAAAAGYQSWLQSQPPDLASCVSGQPGIVERLVEWLGGLSPSLFLATGFCEDDALSPLGLSLANWAMISFVLCVAGALLAVWLDRSRGG